MYVHIISDLHIEFLNNNEIDILLKKYFNVQQDSNTILILAGDIGNPYKSSYKNVLTFVSKIYKYVFICAGNHEFYGNDIQNTSKHIKNMSNTFDNVYFLNRNVYTFDNFVILGCTLWTQVEPSERFVIQNTLNDYKFIKNFTIDTNNELHSSDLQWLNTVVHKSDLPMIVVTHHVPTYELLDPMYKYSRINSGFANKDCDSLFSKIDYWICGHTHKFKITEIDNCKCICNPIGYKDENKKVEVYKFHLP